MKIPEGILTRLSTNALVISCINLPAFGYIGAYDSYQDGYKILETKFSGLRELLKRADAGECLMNIYEKAGENGMENQQYKIDCNYWPIKLSWIELLLAQKIIFEPLNIDKKNHLLSLSLEKFKMKKANKDIYSDDLLTTSLLMGRLLHSLDYSEFENSYNQNETLRNFLDTSKMLDNKSIDLIFKNAENYLNN